MTVVQFVNDISVELLKYTGKKLLFTILPTVSLFQLTEKEHRFPTDTNRFTQFSTEPSLFKSPIYWIGNGLQAGTLPSITVTEMEGGGHSI